MFLDYIFYNNITQYIYSKKRLSIYPVLLMVYLYFSFDIKGH